MGTIFSLMFFWVLGSFFSGVDSPVEPQKPIPYTYDNGPDYVQEGLYRFVENGKIGFANEKWEKIIPANYDFATPFSHGLATFNLGGKNVKTDDEHSMWEGGVWGAIDKKGSVVIQPIYAGMGEFDGRNIEAWTADAQRVLLNRKGRVVKYLTTGKGE